jgi:hypothetical protein
MGNSKSVSLPPVIVQLKAACEAKRSAEANRIWHELYDEWKEAKENFENTLKSLLSKVIFGNPQLGNLVDPFLLCTMPEEEKVEYVKSSPFILPQIQEFQIKQSLMIEACKVVQKYTDKRNFLARLNHRQKQLNDLDEKIQQRISSGIVI